MRFFAILILIFAGVPAALSQSPGKADPDTPSQPPEKLTIFAHPDDTPWYIAGQSNIIFQSHSGFHSPYEGENSLRGTAEYKVSLLGTLFLGYQLQRFLHRAPTDRSLRYNTDIILNVESTGGRGLSQALGLGGFTNLDVVRNPNLGSTPYIARAEIHQTIGLTSEMVDAPRTALSLATKVPVRRIEIRLGKMSMPDMFDLNSVLSDSHLQFTNWAVDNNGAWDYAADTRGYTYALAVEFQDRNWAARYALALMPTVANGIHLDWSLRRAHGQNFELELRHSLIHSRTGAQRFLGYVNTAHMGSYREATNAFQSGVDSIPDITKHEHFGAIKYGFGYNVEQELTDNLRVAARLGWNEGQHESFAYTEIDQTVLVGADYKGNRWNRQNDKVGVAFVSDAIKSDHQNYLKAGGLGFILGDGHLNYGRENIAEAYYNLHSYRGLYFDLGLSHILNPGYNRDRGPVWVPSVRAHADF